MTKQNVSQEVADRLNEMLTGGIWDRGTIIQTRATGFNSPHNQMLNDLTVEELALALFVGYEVKKPVIELPETGKDLEKKAEGLAEYRETLSDSEFLSYRDGVKDGIYIALKDLGIKVEGITK